MVAFALSRPRVNHLTIEIVLLGFLGGGTLGLCFAALTEVYILPTAYGTFFGVGLIEEGAKAIVLVAAARGLSARASRARDDPGRDRGRWSSPRSRSSATRSRRSWRTSTTTGC